MNHFRLFPIFILFVALFALAACGGQTVKATSPTAAPPEPVTQPASAQINCTVQGETKCVRCPMMARFDRHGYFLP